MSPARPTRPALSALALMLTGFGGTGCAFAPGDPYGEVTASLDAHYAELGDRDAGGGFQTLDTDFQVRLTSGQLAFDAIELFDSGTDAVAATFDPANPPPGYGSCHSGHCHAADGSLVSYEDIAAELLVGGASGAQTVVTLTSEPITLLDPVPAALTCTPSCALPQGHLVLARLTAHELTVEGQVRDGRTDPRIDGVVDWHATLTLAEHEHEHAEQTEPDPHDHEAEETESVHGVFDALLDLPVNEDELSGIELAFSWIANPQLFDEIDFASLPPGPDGSLELSDETAPEVHEQVVVHIDALHLEVEATRSGD